MNESILKEGNGKINLSQSIELCDIIKIDNILNHDFKKSSLKVNGFSIEKKEKYYFVSKGRFFKNDKIFTLYNQAKELDHILLKYRTTFLKLKDDKELITSDINQLVCYLYYDLLINLEIAAYKHNLDINSDKEKDYIHKLLGKKLDYSKKKKKSNQKEYKKSTLIQRATNAKYWHRRYCSKGLLSSISKVSEQINPIELEFPLKYENEKVFSLLKDFLDVLNILEIENRDFQIRFKKLGHYRKEGNVFKKFKNIKLLTQDIQKQSFMNLVISYTKQILHFI